MHLKPDRCDTPYAKGSDHRGNYNPTHEFRIYLSAGVIRFQ